MSYLFPSENKISEATRRDIFDSLSIRSFNWSGRLEEPDFLARIFDINSLPSTDGRFRDAYGDIWQHRINNYDWEDDWVFTDPRFNLLHCDDEIFLRFLCEMIHPVVRPDTEEAQEVCEELNVHLKRDGFRIMETTRLSGKPVFSAKAIEAFNVSSLNIAKQSFQIIDESYLSQQITRMESAIESDPALAIGTAKELIETICKTIISQRSGVCPINEKLPKLVRQVAEHLKLTPEGIPNEAKAAQTIKSILGSLSTITQGVAELRNEYGSGHGKEAGSKGLTPRHARLVVGVASTLAVFLWETHSTNN